MSLKQHLAVQQQRLQQLIQLLTEEQAALSQAQVDGKQLANIAADKEKLFTQLESFEVQRQQVQNKLGYSVGMAGAELAALDAHCLPLWHALLESAQRVAQLNQLNGELIKQRIEYNQRMLNFLHEAAGQSLYGPDGQTCKTSGQISSKA